MKTLIAVDGSKESISALKTASQILRKENNKFELVCVTTDFNLPNIKEKDKQVSFHHQASEYRNRINLENQLILEQVHAILLKEGIESEAISDIGSPSKIITTLADDYDITVIGAKGKGTKLNPGLGPVAGNVAIHAAGVTLIVRELIETADLKILFAADISQASINTLDVMLSYFNLQTASITLMHVVETPWIYSGLSSDWFETHDENEKIHISEPAVQINKQLHSDAEDFLYRMNSRIHQYCSDVEVLIEEGNPATEILGEAEQHGYNLIIIGPTQQADLKHKVLGSVSYKIAWQAPCSVALIKPF